ncbi:hypothetical protein [Pseudofulvibacter geojedonensis]|uniref:Uncharacterized protein n=1 Tax=Pseudofulvibacter geojedonensis TaxID=1123758 RepID=A0ABW3I661_9FLAO
MKKILDLLKILLLIVVFTNCATDNDDTSISAPSDFYYPAGGPIPFYTNGSTGTPNIDWGNETGTFTLNSNYTGVSINNTTGILSWNEDLPLNENIIEVTATNSAGFAVTTVLFLHQFSGTFNGGYNNNPSSTTVSNNNLNIVFNTNETMSATDSGNTVNGTWSFNNDGKLICLYGSTELELDLTYSVNVTPLLEGFTRTTGNATNNGFVRLNYQE